MGIDSLKFKKYIHGLSLNSWPFKSIFYQNGWLVRLSEGYTKRANSVFTNDYDGVNLINDIEYIENIYQNENLDVVYQITDFTEPPELDGTLEDRGYLKDSLTEVRILNLSDIDKWEVNTTVELIIDDNLSGPWIDHYCKIQQIDDKAVTYLTNILNRIREAKIHYFSLLDVNKSVLGQGIGISMQGYMLIVNIVVKEIYRKQGYGEQLMRLIINYAIDNCKYIYLQVMKNNTAAMKLYEKLRFREIYEYHYRILRSVQN